METPGKQTVSWKIPLLIVLAGGVISYAVISSPIFERTERSNIPAAVREAGSGSIIENIALLNPITKEDHVLGNPEAEIIIVEYADTECTYCKRLHATLEEIMKEFGRDGRVAWVYRHFPLISIHKNSFDEARATECAAILGNEELFWEYLRTLFAETSGNDNLDPSRLPEIAREIGLDREDFDYCMAVSIEPRRRVERDLSNGVEVGFADTPMTIILVKGKQSILVPGDQPYSTFAAIIKGALEQ